MANIINSLVPSLLPKHIVIVMDGNGRWAQHRMLPRVAGHHRGVEAVRKVVRFCSENSIEILTLFAFSSENWRRPAYEIKTLMSLLNKVLVNEVKEIHSNNICLHVVGNTKELALPLQQAINKAQELTKNNTGLHLNIAINYSGKWDLTQAMQNIAIDLNQSNITAQQIDENLIARYLSLADFPEPDLFIRTSGEQRISNFLLWQLAYTELYFTPTLWPDFDEKSMREALLWYSSRQRRFGTIEQEQEIGNTVNA
jgi:undecaprenyl diphosphate synthase